MYATRHPQHVSPDQVWSMKLLQGGVNSNYLKIH